MARGAEGSLARSPGPRPPPAVWWPGFRGCCGKFCQGHLEGKWGVSPVPQPPREVGGTRRHHPESPQEPIPTAPENNFSQLRRRGPGPGCDSQNYDQEPPDGPTEIGLYDTHINPVPSHELNSIARPIHEGRGDAPRVTDITPSCGMWNGGPDAICS